MSKRQSSIFSLESLGLTLKQEEFCYEDLTDMELREMLQNLVRRNLFLRLENDIFERYVTRQDPDSLQLIIQILETTAKRMQKFISQHSPVSPVRSGSVISVRDKDTTSIVSTPSRSRLSRYTAPSIIGTRTKGEIKLAFTYRLELVNAEIRQLSKDLADLEQKFVKKNIQLRAQIEEYEISIREIRVTREEFEKNVVQEGVDSITGKIPAETFIRFTDEWLRGIDLALQQIGLKMMTIRFQMKKAKLQLKRRRELGEALRAVDFEQLNIENQDCIRKIDEKNQHFLEMKKIAGRYSIALTKHKEKLGNMMSMANEVRGKIVSRKQEIVKLQSEQKDVNIEIKKAETQLKSLTKLMDDFSVPGVIEFIKMHTEYQELYKIRKRLSRQSKIQKISFKPDR